MNPDTLTAQALLNCLVREVSLPEEQAWPDDDGHLARPAGQVWPAAADRPPAAGRPGPGPRLTGDAELRDRDGWRPLAGPSWPGSSRTS